jgi:hypothetical protein
MAFLDQLLISAEVDPSGISRGLASAITQLQQFDRQIEQIFSQNLKLTVDVAPIAPAADLTAFTAGLRQGIAEGLAELEGALPPIVLPAPVLTPPSPPDFSETIAEAIRAADIMRAEFLSAFPVQALGIEAKQGASLAANELEAGLLARVGELRDLVATGIISPASFTAQVDLAIAAMAREIEAKQASLPALVLRTRGGQTDAGIITDADLANVRQFDQVAQQATDETEKLIVATNRGRTAFEGHGRAALAARSSLTVLASQALGTSSTLGRLAESALLFAGGSAAVIATAGTVLVIAKAYEVLTSDATKAQKAIDDAVQSIRHAREQGGGPVEVANRELNLLIEAEKKQRALLIAESGQSGAVPDALTKSWADRLQFAVAPIMGHIRDTQKEITQQALDEVKARQDLAQALTNQFNAALQFQKQAQAARISALSDAPGLGTDTGVSARQRSIEEARLQGIIHSTTASLEERNEAARQFNALVEGAQVPLDRQRREALEIATAQASAYHDVAQAFADAIAVVQRAISNLSQGDEFTKLIARQKAQAADVLQAIPGPSGVIGQQFDTATSAVKDTQQALEDAITASNRFGAAAVRNANDTRNAHQKLNDAIHDTTRGLDAVVGAARNVGLIGDEAANAIGAVLDLSDAIGNVIEKASTGNILGLIGAGIGVAGTLLGQSATQQEHDRILEENNARLRELSVNLERTQGLSAAQAAIDLSQVLASLPIIGFAGSPIDLIRNLSTPDLTKALREAGLSLADFEKIVKDQTGLEILDSKGHLLADTLDQATEALKRSIEAQLHFAHTFDAQAQAADLRSRLTGESQAPRDIFARELNVADDFSNAIRQAFAGVDLGSEDAVRQAVVDLFDRFNAGQLTAEDLGLSKDDFLKFLNDAATFLGSLNAATEALTQSFAEQLASTQLRSRLAGESQDPAAAFQREIDTLLQVFGSASPEIAAQLANIDLGDPDAVRRALLSLFDQAAAGGLNLTADQQAVLNQLLSDGAGFLDNFNKEVQGATDRLGDLNVPEGFRRAALAFVNSNTGPFIPPSPTDVVQVPLNLVNLIQTAASSPTTSIGEFSINIYQQPGESGEALSERVVQRLQRLGVLQSGNTQAFGPF